ncbi:hypothetical protein NDU88_006732, partial [Pleurodeles waltl]
LHRTASYQRSLPLHLFMWFNHSGSTIHPISYDTCVGSYMLCVLLDQLGHKCPFQVSILQTLVNQVQF